MKTKHILLLSLLVFISSSTFATELRFATYSLNKSAAKKSIIEGKKIFLDTFEAIGEFHEAGDELSSNLLPAEVATTNKTKGFYKDTYHTSENEFIRKSKLVLVDTPEEATTSIGGSYDIKFTDETKEMKWIDKSTKIPYFTKTTVRKAVVTCYVKVTYKESAPLLDTMLIEKTSWAHYANLPRQDEESLVNSAMSELAIKLRKKWAAKSYIKSTMTWFNFPKLKVKDEALLAEYKTIDLKDGWISEALPIYLKIYEQNPKNKKAILCIGYCYEILGNYEEALKFYQLGKADTACMMRIKKAQKLVKYMAEKGYLD